ncbi:pimeloyl-ACP methyl ester carboxylesterase [Filimonas zeae]|uniref:Alpha/beta hydrolase n=1 Tax=Filimonas zeae TaxID=1737353 RepID=A0A917MYH3_9BACT|nr:alpha/beta hydrolase [Filimonas zeae]MDR6342169.1 pimeloyl-ACP methyl ester carboxylesterase [Filimonas zeae]GGH78836.1 alpha/beta hydrolase [Filimonas zeae]
MPDFLYNSRNIRYVKSGAGIPVVLLHGFGEDSRVWNNQIAWLEQSFQVIAPDIPGSGGSDRLHDLPEAGIEEYADAMYALLQQEHITRCTLLGHSMGGYIALALAQKHPDIINGLGLVHSTAFADNEEKKANRQRGIQMMDQYGGAAFLKTTIPNLFSVSYKMTNADEINKLIEQGNEFSTQSLQQYYYAMMTRPDRSSVLTEIKKPVLFIAGTEDVAVPINDVLKQTSMPDYSYIHVLDHVGHMGIWETPDIVNRFISDFVMAANR